MNRSILTALASLLLVLAANALAEPVASDRLAVGLPASGAPQGELVELAAEGGSFLAIFQARQHAEHRGGILLLHDQGTRANSLEVIRPLRLGLAEAGWDTLSLQLPAARRDRHDSAWQSGHALIQARLKAGLTWLKARKQPVLAVIALGASGVIALNYASQPPLPEFQALVLVSMPTAATDDTGALAGQVRLPVLDIYAERDHGPVLQGAAARKHTMGGDKDYTQTAIAGAKAGFFGLEGSLLGRVRGWLAVKTAAQAAGSD